MIWKVEVLMHDKKNKKNKKLSWLRRVDFSLPSLIFSCCFLFVAYTHHLHSSYRLSYCFPLLWLYRPHAFHLYCDFPPSVFSARAPFALLVKISKHSGVLSFWVWYLFSVFVPLCLPFIVCLTVGSLFFGCLPECQPTFESKKTKTKSHLTIFRAFSRVWSLTFACALLCIFSSRYVYCKDAYACLKS